MAKEEYNLPEGLRAMGSKQINPGDKGFARIAGKDLHPRQFQLMVRNIENAVRSASPQDIKGGSEWYKQAQEIAHEIGGGDIRKGAGIIAATSPGTAWNTNIRMARDVAKTGTTRGYITQAELGKAQRIREGEDPETILPMGLKTGHFFKNILDPSDPSAVTIDRHAHDLAVGRKLGSANRALGAPGRYNTFVSAHMQATNKLSDMGIEVPNQTQAISWVNWRRLHGITD
jgi:hypothetical protein